LPSLYSPGSWLMPWPARCPRRIHLGKLLAQESGETIYRNWPVDPG
jgi:hypothetical protein